MTNPHVSCVEPLSISNEYILTQSCADSGQMYSKRALKMGKSGKAGRRLFWQKKNTDEEGTAKESLHSTENGNVAGHAENSGEFVPRDGGWGWVVCFTALWANGTVFGIINTFGIVYIQMREHYSKNDPEVSLKTGMCKMITIIIVY